MKNIKTQKGQLTKITKKTQKENLPKITKKMEPKLTKHPKILKKRNRNLKGQA